ncbi:MAG: dephospho-CoA kinase [Paracoccaceae bacterium]
MSAPARPFVLGLTGSIGMGKTTTAGLFAAEGVPVWDADAAVHRLYGPGGQAVAAVAALWPDVIAGGAVSRPHLRERIATDPGALDRLQAVVHPLVAQDRAAFLASAATPVVLLDVPLLFESGAAALCDAVVVVTAPPEVQRARVLARGGMDAAALDLFLSRQMPDADKRARATWVIETRDLDSARADVRRILAEISKGLPSA